MGNGVRMARLGVERGIGAPGGRTAGVDAHGRLSRLGDQPEVVAAQSVHMRIDHGDGGRRGDHGFDGVAAVLQYTQPCLGCQMMGGGDHAASGGRREDHGGPFINLAEIGTL